VNFSAKLAGLDAIIGHLKNLGDALAGPATNAAADALAQTLEQTRKAEGLTAPLDRKRAGATAEIGASDPDSVAREFGTLETEPSPWLAPSLPAAQGPMRAAIASAAARAISTLRSNR
jgi:hypothetical protein